MTITAIITRLTEIDIAPLAVLLTVINGVININGYGGTV